MTLCHTLIAAGLTDEYCLFVYPAVQGRSRRLFPERFALPALTLLEAKSLRSGVIYSRYAPVRLFYTPAPAGNSHCIWMSCYPGTRAER
jgi:dihydrofolate reductase